MRRVVGRNHVDRAVLQSVDQRPAVVLGAQRRIHARVDAVIQNVLLRHAQMMRCDLGMDVRTQLFARTDQLHRKCRAEMLERNAGARAQRQRDVARHHAFLRGRHGTRHAELDGCRTAVVDTRRQDEVRLLLVEGEWNIQVLCPAHGLQTQLGIVQIDAVIRKARCPRRMQSGKVGQFFSLQSLGDGRRLQHMDRHLFCPVLYIIQSFHRVHDRLGVRHADHRREAAGRRRRRAGEHILLVRQTRIAKMHMHIHQTRRHRPPRQIHGRAVRRQFRTDRGKNAVVINQEIRPAFRVGIRIEQQALFQ